MKVAIVGSRRRNSLTDRKIVMSLVEHLILRYGKDLELVSGACPKGADDFAAQASRIYGVPIKEFPVDTSEVHSHWQFREKAFERNRSVAEYADIGYALVHSDRTGGTENTLEHARKLKKSFMLVDDSGQIYLDPDASPPDKVGAP